MIGLVRDELATFLYWLAARLEKKHVEAVVRYYGQDWSHTGKPAVTTKQPPPDHSWLKTEPVNTKHKKDAA